MAKMASYNDVLRAFHVAEVGSPASGASGRAGEPYTSCLENRLHVSLRPVFLRTAMAVMGSTSSEGSLSTASRDRGTLWHSYDYRMFEYDTSQTKAWPSVQSRSIKVVNIGSEFRGRYGSFSSTASLPLLLPAGEPCSFQEPSSDENGEGVGEGNAAMERFSEDFSLEQLRESMAKEDRKVLGWRVDGRIDGGRRKGGWRLRSPEEVRARFAKEEKLRRVGGKADTPLVRALTWGLRNVETAEEVAKVVEGLPLKIQICCSVIQKLGMERQTGAALSLFHWLQGSDSLQPNVYIYNSLLGALKANKEFSMASQVVSWMEEAGIAPDIVTYNTLISLCEQRGDPKGAFRVFETLKSSGSQPNLFTYRNLINICKQQEELGHALELYKEMVHGDLVLKTERERAQLVETEANLRKLCNEEMHRRVSGIGKLQSSGPTEVFSVFRHMQDVKIRPDGDSYSQVLWACCQEPVVFQRTARALLAEMYSRGFKPNVSLCNALICALGKAKKWWAALEIFQRMLSVGPPPTEATRGELLAQFGQLLSYARKRRLWKWSIQLLERMKKVGLEPDSKTWATVVVTCAMASQTEASLRVFRGMVEKGHKPGVITYGALLSALEKGDLLDTALEVWEHMRRVGVEPNMHAYTTLVVAYGRKGEYGEAVRVFEELRSSGVSVDVVAYNAILTACAYTGQGLRALDWLQQMERKNVQPNPVTYQQVIEALANEGQWQAAVDVYVRARLEGTEPTSASYDSVMRVCLANKAPVEPGLLGPRPLDRVENRTTLQVGPHCKLVLKTAYEDDENC